MPTDPAPEKGTREDSRMENRDELRFYANRLLAERPVPDDTRISVESATFLELLDAERQRDALLAWVRAHGVHSPFCAYLNPGNDCDCGLRAALDGSRLAVFAGRRAPDEDRLVEFGAAVIAAWTGVRVSDSLRDFVRTHLASLDPDPSDWFRRTEAAAYLARLGELAYLASHDAPENFEVGGR